MRTTKASASTPNASDSPIDLITGSASSRKAANTAVMMIAAAVTTRPLSVAGHNGLAGVPGLDVRFAHAGHQEHLVVHRQPEQDPDQQDRQEADDRSGLGDGEEVGQVTVLEDPDDQAHRGGDAEQEAGGFAGRSREVRRLGFRLRNSSFAGRAGRSWA
jgi:hypothetical protein